MFSKRKFTFGSLAVAAAVAALGLGSATQAAAVYTYTPNNAGTDTWSSGTDWSATPVSGASNTLTFVGTNTTVLANGLANTNTDDINGGFQANVINLQGTGPASGAATINIAAASGAYLNMVNNGVTGTNNAPVNPIINLSANAGAAGLTYNVSAPITVSGASTALTLTNNNVAGTGSAAFNFSGGITANKAGFSDMAPGTVTLSGATNTFEGGFSLSPNSPGGALNVNASINVTGAGTGGLAITREGTITQDHNATVNLGTVGSTTNYANGALIGEGYSGTTGTYTLNSGTLNINVSSSKGLTLGYSAGTTGILNVNGGTLNNYAENSATPTADALTTLYVAAAGATSNAPGSTGTVNQNGGTVNTGQVWLGVSGSTAATYNLDGGTLATSSVYSGTGYGPVGNGVFNFNGGTLQVNGSAAGPAYRLIKYLAAANVQNGGAFINTNGFGAEIDQALLSDPSSPNTLDGGLTKSGAGTLVLTGANTYTGATTVAGGTLELAGNTGSLANSNITIASGAALTGGASNSLGVLNFNINGNTSNLITDNGTFNITDLSLVLNLTGTQTLSQYVLANYTGGTLSGTKFYATTLANGWSINYGTLHPNEIVLVNANAAVPEPATLGLFGAGALGLLLLGKRRHA